MTPTPYTCPCCGNLLREGAQVVVVGDTVTCSARCASTLYQVPDRAPRHVPYADHPPGTLAHQLAQLAAAGALLLDTIARELNRNVRGIARAIRHGNRP